MIIANANTIGEAAKGITRGEAPIPPQPTPSVTPSVSPTVTPTPSATPTPTPTPSSSPAPSNLILDLDAADTASFTGSTGATWFDLTANNNDFGLVTGGTTASFNAVSGGYISFFSGAPGTGYTNNNNQMRSFVSSSHTIISIQKKTAGNGTDIFCVGPLGNAGASLLVHDGGSPYTLRDHIWHGSGVAVIDATGSLNDTWYHTAHVVNYASGTLEFYVNNVFIGSISGVTVAAGTLPDDYCLGVRTPGSNCGTDFDFGIQETYNRPFSATDVSASYAAYQSRYSLGGFP